MPNLNLKLRDIDNEDKAVGNIECSDSSGEFIEGNRINCKIIKPQLTNYTSHVYLTDFGG